MTSEDIRPDFSSEQVGGEYRWSLPPRGHFAWRHLSSDFWLFTVFGWLLGLWVIIGFEGQMLAWVFGLALMCPGFMLGLEHFIIMRWGRTWIRMNPEKLLIKVSCHGLCRQAAWKLRDISSFSTASAWSDGSSCMVLAIHGDRVSPVDRDSSPADYRNLDGLEGYPEIWLSRLERELQSACLHLTGRASSSRKLARRQAPSKATAAPTVRTKLVLEPVPAPDSAWPVQYVLPSAIERKALRSWLLVFGGWVLFSSACVLLWDLFEARGVWPDSFLWWLGLVGLPGIPAFLAFQQLRRPPVLIKLSAASAAPGDRIAVAWEIRPPVSRITRLTIRLRCEGFADDHAGRLQKQTIEEIVHHQAGPLKEERGECFLTIPKGNPKAGGRTVTRVAGWKIIFQASVPLTLKSSQTLPLTIENTE